MLAYLITACAAAWFAHRRFREDFWMAPWWAYFGAVLIAGALWPMLALGLLVAWSRERLS